MPRGRGTRARDARRNRPADVDLSDMIACYTIVQLQDQRASETDFTKDLKRFDVPTLVVHGDDDQVVPVDAAGRASAKLVQDARLIIYEGGPHGITDTHKDRLNADLLAFVQG
jgi:pimeloyl-ACP methyl ester carboxylesterase